MRVELKLIFCFSLGLTWVVNEIYIYFLPHWEGMVTISNQNDFIKLNDKWENKQKEEQIYITKKKYIITFC